MLRRNLLEFSNENLCGVLEPPQLPVLDRPGIACSRLRLQGQKDLVMAIFHCLVCSVVRGDDLSCDSSVLCIQAGTTV